MKAITEKTDIELEKLLGEKKAALRVFRFGFAGGKTKNTKEGRLLRKDIARILTEVSKRKQA